MFPSKRFGAPSHRILSLPLIGLLLAGASCGGGSSAKPDGSTPGNDTAAMGDRGGGGGSSGGDVGPIGNTPVEQCKGLVAVICSRFGECQMKTPADVADCNVVLNVQFGCDRATSAEFPTCLTDTRALSCASLFTANGIQTPASCDTPLNIPLSDAQTKCVALVNALCQRSNECQGGTATPQQLADCADQLIFGAMGIPCPIVVSVSAKYDMCLAEIKVAMCTVRPDGGAADASMPADAGDAAMMSSIPSCTGVIMTP
ncbi:MAG TPA: hypothetical protein VFH73_08120 [Polyangia bacterium]|jgi:hypothetical protein|nr:hypothetical protein [Polyangia bacterium]